MANDLTSNKFIHKELASCQIIQIRDRSIRSVMKIRHHLCFRVRYRQIFLRWQLHRRVMKDVKETIRRGQISLRTKS